jgi:hypothetical protein
MNKVAKEIFDERPLLTAVKTLQGTPVYAGISDFPSKANP